MSVMKQIRKTFDVSQTEFARIIGVSQAAVSRWEVHSIVPRTETFNRIHSAARRRRLPWRKSWPKL